MRRCDLEAFAGVRYLCLIPCRLERILWRRTKVAYAINTCFLFSTCFCHRGLHMYYVLCTYLRLYISFSFNTGDKVIVSTREWNKLHLCCYDFTSSDVWTIYFGSEGACFPRIAVDLHPWKSQILFIVTSFRTPPVRLLVAWGLYTVYTKKTAYTSKQKKNWGL